MRTLVTCTSSSAQPVTAIEPVSPVALSSGVSNDPNGAADAPSGTSVSPTEMTALTTPGTSIVTEPASVPAAGKPAVRTTPIDRVEVLMPPDGETVIQGWVAV